MDHNKKSGNDRIEVQYKAEVEEILDGNRPSLTPKLLGSSLDLNEVGIEEEEVPFGEITGCNKRKSRSDIQEEKPRKANRSEVGKVKNLPYKKRMSRKCPENVQNNNIQIPDIIIVWKMFQNMVVSGHSFCPEFVQVQNLS